METIIRVGDVLDEAADVLICTANPWLNLSGGVGGAILVRGGECMQDELHQYLRQTKQRAVKAATVVVSGPGPLAFKHVLHAVAIDPFYDSSPELVQQTLERALRTATELGARSVALPTLATGYGHLSMEQFGVGLAKAVQAEWPSIERLMVVVRKPEHVEMLCKCLRR